MAVLSPEARGLVHVGQSLLRPSLGDRARVASALASRLGAAVFEAPELVGAPAPRSASMWQNLSTLAAGVGLGIVALGLLVSSAPSSSLPATEPSPARLAVPSSLASPLDTVPVGGAVHAGAALGALEPEPSVTAARKRAPADLLAEEVAILSRATSALRAGQPADGLRWLARHQREFPNGRLVEERRSARIQALCALGKLAAAEAELARLAESAPRSPQLARARRACGITP